MRNLNKGMIRGILVFLFLLIDRYGSIANTIEKEKEDINIRLNERTKQ
jgi:hypothetical protein